MGLIVLYVGSAGVLFFFVELGNDVCGVSFCVKEDCLPYRRGTRVPFPLYQTVVPFLYVNNVCKCHVYIIPYCIFLGMQSNTNIYMLIFFVKIFEIKCGE